MAANLSASGLQGFTASFKPVLRVGDPGWNVSFEEHSVIRAGAVTSPAVSSDPIFGYSTGSVGGSHEQRTILLTTPNVTAILVNDKTRVPTFALPGLPYGYRAARIVTAAPAEERIPPGLGRRPSRRPESFVALDAHGQPIHSPRQREALSQGSVRVWEYPGKTPQGACGLRASPPSGLTARHGEVLSDVQPYPSGLTGAQIVGHAFLPCVHVEYHLQGLSLQAWILLDAAHPGARVAALPDFRAVPGVSGFMQEDDFTARREGNAWLVVSQGSGLAQRVAMLRHLTGLFRLGALVPASSGVAESGHANAPEPAIPSISVRAFPALEAGAFGWDSTEAPASTNFF